MTPLELRTKNRYELHPQNKRQCNTCLVIHDGSAENFHVKRHFANSPPAYEPACKPCRRKHLRESKAKYRLNPEQMISQRIAAFRHRAESQSLAFDLDADYLIQQWNDQAGYCFYSAEPMCFTNVTEKQNSPHPNQPSLDKLDPEKGYVRGNVVWCSNRINIMKGDFTYDQFIKMCSHITEVRKRYDE